MRTTNIWYAKCTLVELEKILRLYKSGLSQRKIAAMYKVNRYQIRAALNRCVDENIISGIELDNIHDTHKLNLR